MVRVYRCNERMGGGNGIIQLSGALGGVTVNPCSESGGWTSRIPVELAFFI